MELLLIIKGGSYSWKINRNFYELFYVIKGEVKVEFEDKTEIINEGDVFIIEPDIKHKTSAEFADIFIVCNPPFDINNIEFVND